MLPLYFVCFRAICPKNGLWVNANLKFGIVAILEGNKLSYEEYASVLNVCVIIFCSRYNARSDWPIVGNYSPGMHTGQLRCNFLKQRSIF